MTSDALPVRPDARAERAALGHAKLLDERHATTHWQHTHPLAVRFPRAHVDPGRLHLRDGPLVTSAGTHLIRRGGNPPRIAVARPTGAAIAPPGRT
jgi:hypothetical protein